MANRDAVTVRVEIDEKKQQEGNELTKRAGAELASAEAFTIAGAADFEMAGETLAKLGKTIDAIDAHRKDMTRPIDRAKAEIMDKFKPALALLADAKQIINRKMIAYRDEAERKRREQQAKLDEEARKERERIEKQAQKAAEQGKTTKAMELAQKAAATTAPVVAAAPVPEVKGVAVRKTWRASCDDVLALCKAVAEGKVPPIAVEPNMTFLHEQARSLEEHFKIPGCTAKPVEAFGRTRG